MTNSLQLRIAAAGLVVGPLLFTLADLARRWVDPSDAPTATDTTAAVGQHPSLWLTAGLLMVAAAFCLVAGVLGLITGVRGRGALTTASGALLVGLGAVASVGHAVAFYAPYALYSQTRLPADAVTALDQASESYPLLVLLIVLFSVGMMLGPLVLFFGLYRARRVPLWSLLAAVIFVVSGVVGGVAAGVVGVLAALAAFVPAARSLTSPPPVASIGAEPSPRPA